MYFFVLFSSSAQTIDHINVGNNYPTPTLKLIEAKNSNGVPVVSITFLDGFEDTMVFHKYNGIDSDEYYDGTDACNQNRCLLHKPY